MSTRMDKYNTDVKSRTNKNEKLYEKVGDISINYDFIDVDNALELNPNDRIKSTRESYKKHRELNNILNKKEYREKTFEEEVIPKENRVYDINEMLKSARDELDESKNKKRLINTEYNILTKLDIKKINDNYRKEDLRSLIDDIYEKEKPKRSVKKRLSTDELLSNLLDDVDDLKDDVKLKEELSKDILDRTFAEEGTIPITEEIKDIGTEIDKNDKTDDIEEKNEIQEDNINNNEIPESIHDNEDDNEMFIFDDLKDKRKKKRKTKKKQKRKETDDEIDEIIKEEAIKEDGIDYDNIKKEGNGLLIAIIIVVILILGTVGFFLYEYFLSN